jgi:hypothetical protein
VTVDVVFYRGGIHDVMGPKIGAIPVVGLLGYYVFYVNADFVGPNGREWGESFDAADRMGDLELKIVEDGSGEIPCYDFILSVPSYAIREVKGSAAVPVSAQGTVGEEADKRGKETGK